MPARPLRPCPHPGCGTLTVQGKCEVHARVVNEQRGTPTERGYDAAWRKLRAAFLLEHPLCECDECRSGEGRVTVATVVDHIKPIATHPELRLVWSNLRAMSKPHHDAHTARTRGWGRAERV
jgi:5-methylcytosine-specific restriction protein A